MHDATEVTVASADLPATPVITASPKAGSVGGQSGRACGRWLNWLGAVVLLVATLAAYAPIRQAGFIWDDDVMVTANPVVQSPEGWRDIWFSTALPDYFPLTSTMLWLEWHWFGDAPLGYHVVNVLLHALGSLLLWRVLARLAIPGAWLAAAAFALHPVNVESAAWITEHKNTLALVCYATALLAWLRFEGTACRRSGWQALALGCFTLALLAKTAVVGFPAVLLLLAWWQRGRITGEDVRHALPFFVVAVVLAGVTLWFQSHRAIGGAAVRTDDAWSRLCVAGRAIWFYFGKALLPVDLSFVYPRWPLPAESAAALASLLALVALAVVSWRWRRTWGRHTLLVLGYSGVMLMPILGFANVGFMRFSLVADRWQYFALIAPLAAVAAWSVSWITVQGRLVRAGAWTLCGVALAWLGRETWQRTPVFHDVGTLWSATLDRNPQSVVAHTELGVWLYEQGRKEGAVAHYRAALAIDDAYESAHYNLGFALLQRGEFGPAAEHLERATRLQQDFMPAYLHLGRARFALGEMDAAEQAFLVTERLAPGLAEAQYQLGNVALRKGRLDEALARFDRTLALRPSDVNTLNDRAIARLQHGDREGARADLVRVLELAPHHEEARHNLALLSQMRGRP